jgi:tetratricopeptide (TPR) repeat protein
LLQLSVGHCDRLCDRVVAGRDIVHNRRHEHQTKCVDLCNGFRTRWSSRLSDINGDAVEVGAGGTITKEDRGVLVGLLGDCQRTEAKLPGPGPANGYGGGAAQSEGHQRTSIPAFEQRIRSLLSQKGVPVQPCLRTDALWTHAHLAHVQCDYAEASTLGEEGLAPYRSEGRTSGIAATLNFLAGLSPDDRVRCKFQEESLAIYREIQNMQGVAAVLNNMGIRARGEQDYERARLLFEECLAIHRGVKNKAGIAVTLHSLSYNAFLQSDFHSARTLGEESLRLHQELGSTRWMMVNLQHLGWVCLRIGRWEEARAFCEESLRLQKVLWVKQELATALECLADIAAMERQWERAACLYGAAEVLIRTHQLTSAEGRTETTQEKVPTLRAALGELAFARAWAKGEAMTIEQAVEYALHGKAT